MLEEDETKIPVAVAVAVEEPTTTPDDSLPVVVTKDEPGEVWTERRAAKCCGCCCDYRRATVVLAIIGISIQAFFMVLSIVGSLGMGIWAAAEYDGGTYETANGATIGAILLIVAAVVFGLGTLVYVCMLFGALRFNVCLLATVLVFNCINLGWYLFQIWVVNMDEEYQSNNIGNASPATSLAVSWILYLVLWGLLNYPIVGLIVEIRKGIMSPETYPREAYSCCCEPKV